METQINCSDTENCDEELEDDEEDDDEDEDIYEGMLNFFWTDYYV